MDNKKELLNFIESKGSTVEKGDLFNELIVKSQFPIDFKNFISTDGSNDGGIDSYWISESQEEEGEDCFFIVQSKYGTSFRGCDTIRAELAKLYEGLSDEDFLGNKGSHLNIRNCLKTRDNDKILNYILGVSEELTDSEYKCLEANIQNLYSLGFSEINYHVITIDKIVESFNYHTSVIPVKLEGYVFANQSKEQLTGYISLGELRKIKKYISKLKDPNIIFSKNVRLDLGGRGKINQDIQATVEKNPYKLSKLNLGITAVTRGELKDIGGNTFNIVGLNISNGAQSFCSINRGLDKIERTMGENNLPLDALIHIEIIQAKSSKEEKSITLARNTSNKVKKASLCATEGESLYRKLRDIAVSEFGEEFNFNLKAVTDTGKEVSGSHDVMSTAGSSIGLFGTAITPTVMLMPNENNPEEFGYKLINELINRPKIAGLIIYISNKCLSKLQTSSGFNKRVAKSTYRGCSGTYTLMQVLFKLVSTYCKDKKFINTLVQDYIDNLETPGLNVNIPDRFAEMGLILLKDPEIRNFLIELSSGIWDTYALNPQTKKGYMYADYYDRFPDKRNSDSKPQDRELNRQLTSKFCPRLSVLTSNTVDELIEKGNYSNILDKIKQTIKSIK